MPFILVSGSNIEGHAQVAIATWILLFWAETAIISEPRHATGRTYWSPPPLSATTLSLAAFSSSTEKGISKSMISADFLKRMECSVVLKITPS